MVAQLRGLRFVPGVPAKFQWPDHLYPEQGLDAQTLGVLRDVAAAFGFPSTGAYLDALAEEGAAILYHLRGVPPC